MYLFENSFKLIKNPAMGLSSKEMLFTANIAKSSSRAETRDSMQACLRWAAVVCGGLKVHVTAQIGSQLN